MHEATQLQVLRQIRSASRYRLLLSNATFWIAVIALAINLGLLYLYYTPSPKQLFGDETYYYQLAVSIAGGQTAQHDLLWPPLYADLLGVLFSIVGVHRPVIQVVQIGMWFASAFLFKDIVARLCPSQPVVHLAFGLFLFSPELMAFSHYLWPETLHLFFWLCGLWWLICHPAHPWSAPLAGMLWGLALLTKLLLLGFLPILFLLLLVSKAFSPIMRTRLIKVTVIGATSFLIILPTLWSNWRMHSVFTIADSSIFNIWVGLHDTSLVDYRDDITGHELNDFQNIAADLPARNAKYTSKLGVELQQEGLWRIAINQLGKQYFRLFDYQTFFTTQLPAGARQTYHFDAPALASMLRLYSHMTYALILVGGMAGMCFIRVRPIGWIHCFLLFVAYNLILFLFLHVKTRYVIQFMPMLIFFAAVAIQQWWSSLRRTNALAIENFVCTPYRIRLSIACGMLMCVIVFHSLLTGT